MSGTVPRLQQPRTTAVCTRGRAARGFSLVITIFVVLVLAALGAFAVKIGVSQQQSANLGLLNARAQAAADSGIEFGINQALLAGSCPPSTPLVPNAIGMPGFSITVTCSASTHQIKALQYQAFVLTSTAQHGNYGTSDFVARTLSRTVTNAPP